MGQADRRQATTALRPVSFVTVSRIGWSLRATAGQREPDVRFVSTGCFLQDGNRVGRVTPREIARSPTHLAGDDGMKRNLVLVALGTQLLAAGPAAAEGLSYGAGLKSIFDETPRWSAGLKDLAVPAPIPVPGAHPIAEGFTYYLRADLSWGMNGSEPSFSENGNTFGAGPAPFAATTGSFVYGQAPGFGPASTSIDDVLSGNIGVGAYFTPRLRGDITLDFRGKQSFDSTTSHGYTSISGGTVDGVVFDTFKMSSTVALANLYFDILPRGAFTPYIGAGIGFTYNDLDHGHSATEVWSGGASRVTTGASKDTNVGLAAALMAGVTLSLHHSWAVDVGYRALYLDGGDVTTILSDGQTTKVSLGDQWEHQVRVGLRWNIW